MEHKKYFIDYEREILLNNGKHECGFRIRIVCVSVCGDED